MKISDEVLRWLKENAYAVKGKGYWFLPSFPLDEMPDSLHIPINKHSWQQIRATLDLEGDKK